MLAVEIAGDKSRTLVAMLIYIPFALGEAVASIVGIWVKDWRAFHVSR